jgi:hypothetical protein
MLMHYAKNSLSPVDGDRGRVARPAFGRGGNLALERCERHRALFRPASTGRRTHRYTATATSGRQRAGCDQSELRATTASATSVGAVHALRGGDAYQRSSLFPGRCGRRHSGINTSAAGWSSASSLRQRAALPRLAADVLDLCTARFISGQLLTQRARDRCCRQGCVRGALNHVSCAQTFNTDAGSSTQAARLTTTCGSAGATSA